MVTLATCRGGWSIQISADLLLSFVFRFRLWCQRVIGHKMFDHVILLFIFLNCITIALERPDIQPSSMVTYIKPAVTCLDPGLTVHSETESFHQRSLKHCHDPHVQRTKTSSVQWHMLSSLCLHCFFTTVVMDLFLARYVTHCSLTPESKLKPHGTP